MYQFLYFRIYRQSQDGATILEQKEKQKKKKEKEKKEHSALYQSRDGAKCPITSPQQEREGGQP